MAHSFPNLTRAGRIGSLVLKNRMAVAAMGVNLAEEDGSCGERILAYHERQAQGGVGLIVMGVTGVAWPAGSNQPRQVAISEDRHIPGLKAVADACHRYGAKVAAQIHHAGMVAVRDFDEGRPAWVPSYPPMGRNDLADYMLPEEMAAFSNADAPPPQLHVMTAEDIDTLVGQFAAAAGRAQAAGIDGVEIHAGHGYIISEFLSPAMNQRDDEYGGSLENRARLLLQIIAAVRARVGRDYPVWVKLDSQEFGREEGITPADAIATARLVEAAGVDAVAVTSYHDANRGALHAESNIPHVEEHMVANATAVRQALNIPVISAGRIEPRSGDRHIGSGHFDFLSMGRKILADPDLPNKISQDQFDQIRPCIYCYCCVSQIYVRRPVKCAVNPETARERTLGILATDARRHFAVVGGGPAGMEAARRLSLAGHQVTLFESGRRLGGTLQFAAIPYEPNERLLRWLRRQVEQADIDVRLNTRPDAQLLRSMAVDEVVVATGASRAMPPIPGSQQDFVFSGEEMRALMLAESHPQLVRKTGPLARTLTRLGAVTGASANPTLVRQASKGWMPLGQRIVIIGGELVGLELAEYLAERGRAVTVLEASSRAGKGLFVVRRMRLLAELKDELQVDITLNVGDVNIGENVVNYTNERGQERRVAADHVIVAQGAASDLSLAESLSGAGFTVHSIGDCNGVGYIEGALESAAELVAGAAPTGNDIPATSSGNKDSDSA